VAETGSTNSDLLAEAAAGAPDGLVLVTDHQTAGRGTRGRVWTDHPGAQLMVSVLLRPVGIAPASLGRLTMAWAVAAAEAAEAVAGVRLGVKWPNDLFDGDGIAKVAGVLAETAVVGGRVDAVVIGMGMNVNGGVPEGLVLPALSLADLAGHEVDRLELLVALLKALASLLGERAAQVPHLYRRWSVTIGRRVRVEVADGSAVVGVAEDVTDDGLLAVSAGGELVTFASGDVTHTRTT
jgi:BirA family biotin operon repressor/biotin-[acetyl-CoA-carboxylase] ligase